MSRQKKSFFFPTLESEERSMGILEPIDFFRMLSLPAVGGLEMESGGRIFVKKTGKG